MKMYVIYLNIILEKYVISLNFSACRIKQTLVMFASYFMALFSC